MNKQDLIQKHDIILSTRLEKIEKLKLKLANGTYYSPLTESAAVEVYKSLVNHAAIHLSAVEFKSVVVPVSGGADSTFMLKILKDAANFLKNSNKPFPKIIGFTLPCTLQDDADHLNDMGLWACEMYADDFTSVNLGKHHKYLVENLFEKDVVMNSGKSLSSLSDEINPNYPQREIKVDKGNIAARLRMMFSYGIAKRLGGAQCSTDNLSEGLTGFWTLCGDEGTFKYIQCIWKGLEQPMLMKVANIPSPFICQKETDGLGISSGDCDQLFASLYSGKETYVDIDTVLINFLSGHSHPDPLNSSVHWKDHPVVNWHLNSDFKRNPHTLSRMNLGLQKIPNLEFGNK